MNRYDMKSEYNPTACEDQVIPVEDPNGCWVRYEDVAALAAQVEALRKALLPFASTGLPTLVNGENYSVMHDRVKDWFGVSEFVRAIECFNKTPQQHLAEIRAQAVSSCADKLGDAFILPHNLRKETQKAEFYKAGWRDAFLFIKQYAASIRQEGHQTWMRDSNVKSAGKIKEGE